MLIIHSSKMDYLFYDGMFLLTISELLEGWLIMGESPYYLNYLLEFSIISSGTIKF